MARTRRTKRTMTRRPKGDWVYRSSAVTTAGGADALGSYSQTTFTVTAGVANAVGKVLYDSKGFMRTSVGGITPPVSMLQDASRSEGAKPLILRVQGQATWEASTWALGNTQAVGMRVIVADQDLLAGQMTIDADYGMWVGGSSTTPSMWANDRRNVWERRFWRDFRENDNSRSTAFFNIPMRRRLQANEALYLYIELPSTSVNVIMQLWMRTFVVDEG